MSEKNKYKGINLPPELVKEIDKIIQNKKFGFTSRAEFVKEALRNQIKNYESEEKN